MKRTLFLILVALSCCPLFLQARPQHRQVVKDTVCACSQEHFQQVVDTFFYQFQAESHRLFDWAYLNTGGDGNSDSNGKDAIALAYIGNTYDTLTKTGDQAFDIYVLGSRMFPDRHLITVNHGWYLTATYSGSILESADIQFQQHALAPDSTAVHFEFNIVFGKFFSLFVSNKIWENVIRWRMEQIFANIVEYAETGTVIDRSSTINH